MRKLLKRVILGLGVGAVLLAAAAWIVLSTPLTRDFRVNLATDILTKAVGQPVIIVGDARVSFFPKPVVMITGLRLPADGFPDTDLATLDLVRFTTPEAYWFGKSKIMSELEASGLVITLLRDNAGNTTWFEQNLDQQNDRKTADNRQGPGIIDFLGARDVTFKDMEVTVMNEKSGFTFDFELTEFIVSQKKQGDADVTDVRYVGKINDEAANFSGRFPDAAPFEIVGQFGDLDFNLNGQKPPGSPQGDFEGELELVCGDLQNLLDSLRLKGTVDGGATARAVITRTNRMVDLKGIKLDTKLATGETARLTGTVNEVGTASDFDLELDVDLVGDNPPPPPAIFIKDIRPEKINTRIIGTDGDIEIDRLELETNAFDDEFRDLGPFRVKSLSRTPDGRIQLLGLTLVIGPEDAPFLSGETNVGDLLKLKDYRIYGELNLPAQFVLLTLDPKDAAKFGRLLGRLEINEVNGNAKLSHFSLNSDGTDLWDADIDVAADNILDFNNIKLLAKINTPNGRLLLDSLQLDPVDIGIVGVDIDASAAETHAEASIKLRANDSVLDNLIYLYFENNSPILRGSINSESIRTEDLREAYRYAAELSRGRSLYAEFREERGYGNFQTPVLTEEDRNVKPDDDLSDYQPLVLKDTPEEARKENTSGYQPLVYTDTPTDLAIDDLFDADKLSRLVDAHISVAIDRIEGQQGVTRLDSAIEIKKGKASFGPVDFAYGSGRTEFAASINFLDSPERLTVGGRTGGWDLGDLLTFVGADIDAAGIIEGKFDLSGQRSSLRDFIYSMNGSLNTNLQNGRIGTALIELAGLGVLPWLFSQERRQGFTEIVCINAPLSFSSGKITSGSTVLETRNVQLVATGTVDLNNKQIDIRADPRPVGKPLARSAWPFEVKGSFDAPNVQVAKRTRRTATQPVQMPQNRVPCIPDVSQLKAEPTNK